LQQRRLIGCIEENVTARREANEMTTVVADMSMSLNGVVVGPDYEVER
jgi:hypothetical protein